MTFRKPESSLKTSTLKGLRSLAIVLGLSPAVVNAIELLPAVKTYFALDSSSRAEVICTARIGDNPEYVTEALEIALRNFEIRYRSSAPAIHPEAARCLWLASEKATPRGMIYGALLAQTLEDRSARIQRAAELGDVDAMWRYARERSSQRPRGGAHYLEWREKAAHAGHPEAQLSLARAYEGEAHELERRHAQLSEKTNALHQTALRWYEAYGTNTNPHDVACSELALPKTFFDEVQRCSLFIRRGVAKDRAAQYYYEGKYGVPQDYARAAMWFRAAIGDGVYVSGKLYARMLDEGLGVPRDPDAAKEVLSKTDAYYKRWLRPIP